MGNMFNMLNVFTKEDIAINIKNGKDEQQFIISPLITKRNKEELDPENQFLLLNAYLNYKGDEFKDKLMQLYLKASDDMFGYMMRRDIDPLPYKMVHDILDMFNIADVYTFVKDIYKVVPPKELKDQIDKTKEKDGDITRAQTYLRTDYWELAALVLILKAALPVIGHFSYIKKNNLDAIHREYTLFNLILTHPVFDSTPMKKLYDFCDTLVNILLKDPTEAAIRIIEKRVPREDFTTYILAFTVFQKISIASVIDDFDGKNIVTRMHTYIHSKLDSRKDVKSAIRAKSTKEEASDVKGDRESLLELYVAATELPKGTEIELDWSVSDINRIIKQLPIEIDMDMVTTTHNILSNNIGNPISKQQKLLLAYIFKTIINPEALEYITMKSMINLLSIGFAYLWKIECRYIALLLTSYVDTTDSEVMSINSTVSRTRLSKELRDKLMEYYPYTRVINKDTNANIAEEAINNLTNEIFVLRWNPTAPDVYLKQVVSNRTEFRVLPHDLKSQITEMVIKLEELRY